MSGNTDAHLKNWSLQWGDGTRPTLTPSYDLVATVAWPEILGWRRSNGPELALRLGGERFFGRLGMHAIQSCARTTSLAWVVEEILAGVERGRAAWAAVAKSAPDRMRAALEEHWRRVPLLATR